MNYTTEIVARVTNRHGEVSEVLIGTVVSDAVSEDTWYEHAYQTEELLHEAARTMRVARYADMLLTDPQPEGSHD
jgi:hypothetical protein